jgi:hypothetical protein
MVKGCGKTQLCHTMCVIAQVRVSSGVEVLAANSHSSQRHGESSPSLSVRSSHIQDMGGAEGKAAYIGRAEQTLAAKNKC